MGSCCFLHSKKTSQPAQVQNNTNIKNSSQPNKPIAPTDFLTLSDNNVQINSNNLLSSKNEEPQTKIQEKLNTTEQKALIIPKIKIPTTLKYNKNNSKTIESLRIGNKIEDTISANILYGYYDLVSGIRKENEGDVIIQLFTNLTDEQREMINSEKLKIYTLKHKNMLDTINVGSIKNLIPYEPFKFGLYYMTLEQKIKNEPMIEREIKAYAETFVKFLEDMHKEEVFPVYFRLKSTFVNPTNDIKIPNIKVNELLIGNANEFYTKISRDEKRENLDCYLPKFFILNENEKNFNKEFDLWNLGCYLFQLRTSLQPWKYPDNDDTSSFINMKTFIEFMKYVHEDNPLQYYINRGGKIKFDPSFSEFLEILFDPQKQETNVYTQLENTEYWLKTYPEPSSADSSESNLKLHLDDQENSSSNLVNEMKSEHSDKDNNKNDDAINLNPQIIEVKNENSESQSLQENHDIIIISSPKENNNNIDDATNKKNENQSEKQNVNKEKIIFDTSLNDEMSQHNNNKLLNSTYKQNLDESNGIQIVDMGAETNNNNCNIERCDENDNSEGDGCYNNKNDNNSENKK